MADETKTYLINIKDNLDQYAQRAADARKAVEEMTIENMKLVNSGKATEAQIEQSNASLKTAQKEYTQAKKTVELATAANKANAGSYDELYKRWQLAQTQLKLLGKTYETNEQGVRVLSKAYTEQSKIVADSKKSLDEFGKGIHDNRLGVGSYSEAIQESIKGLQLMPPSASRAITAIKAMTVVTWGWAAALAATGITLIVAAIALLILGFKNSQALMDIWESTVAGISATVKVFIDRLSNAAEFLVSIFSKSMRESRAEAKALNDELIGIEETMTRREKRELRRANKKGFFEEIKEESAAAKQLTKDIHALEDAEIDFIVTKGKLTRQIAENIDATRQENVTAKEKLKLLEDAVKWQKELTAQEVEFAKERARISDIQTNLGRSTREELKANQELQAAADEAQAAGLRQLKRIATERLGIINKLSAAEASALKKKQDDILKDEAEFQALLGMTKDEMNKQLDLTIQYLDKEVKAHKKAQEDRKKAIADFEEWKRTRALIDAENELQIREINREWEFDIQRDYLQMQQDEEIRMAKDTEASVILINQKYHDARIELAILERDAKLEIYAGFAGNLATIFGEQTAIGKAAAVASTLISTYQGAQAAYTSQLIAGDPTSIIRAYIAAAAATVTGLANVKKILAIKSGLPGGSGRGATAITSAPATSRVFAQPAGVSALTGTTSAESVKSANLESSMAGENMKGAFDNMPPIIVTVEDINAKVLEKQKVEVRANI